MKHRFSLILFLVAAMFFMAACPQSWAVTVPTLTTEMAGGEPNRAGGDFQVRVKVVNTMFPTIPALALARVYWNQSAYLDLDTTMTLEGNTNGIWGMNEKDLGPIAIGEKITDGAWVYRDIGTYGNTDNTNPDAEAFTLYFYISSAFPVGEKYTIYLTDSTITGAITLGEVQTTIIDLGDGLILELEDIVEMSVGHDFDSTATTDIEIASGVRDWFLY
ncbi:MAG TPA: hypothetical protein PK395_17755 [bacterium]|nr:hypothetical protein [bacterium]